MPATINNTKLMMAVYNEVLATMPSLFLSSFFGKNPTELYLSNNEKVEIDIKRDEELIAIDVMRDGDGNGNVSERYSTKEYSPPLYDEYLPVTASMLNKRSPGVNPFVEESKTSKFARIATEGLVKMTRKIHRAIEKQASQCLFSGIITLINTESLDFKRKATHNITPANLWSDTTLANPIADLSAACQVNRIDGKMTSNICIMGTAAWDAFIVHPKVTAYLDNRRIEAGNIEPRFAAEGATFQGIIWVGDYRLELYTYPQYYKPSEILDAEPYVPEKQVIVFNGNARLNKAFAAVEILPMFVDGAQGIGLSVPEMRAGQFASYAIPKPPKNISVGVQSAPVLIPVAIDTISNLNVLA
jgi:hypothetical protein